MMPARELNSLAEVINAAMVAGRRTAMGIAVALSESGRVVPVGGAAELSRLQALMNAQPAELTEVQVEALIDAGNAALADYYHERACACRDYPEGCATNPQYRRAGGFWDTDAFAVGAPAVIGLWEVLRAPGDVAAGELRASVAASAASEVVLQQQIDAQAKEIDRLQAHAKHMEPFEALTPQSCEKGQHLDWFSDSEDHHACPWCRIVELEDRLCASGAAAEQRHQLYDPSEPPPAVAGCVLPLPGSVCALAVVDLAMAPHAEPCRFPSGRDCTCVPQAVDA